MSDHDISNEAVKPGGGRRDQPSRMKRGMLACMFRFADVLTAVHANPVRNTGGLDAEGARELRFNCVLLPSSGCSGHEDEAELG